ncbi:MAG TPA: hypothetical protein VKT31_10510 [Solirubrobacteraceae bacterium]|nr:hypothetical protein [Solirubrobacteraceae bacterium]
MVFVWILLAIIFIGVFVAVVAWLGFGIHGDARDRRGRFRGRHRPASQDADHPVVR